MSRESYVAAVADFCAGAGIDDVPEMLHRGLIEVDGMPVEITYSEALDTCRIEVDLGEPPREGGDNFLRFVLALNTDAETTVFGLDPYSGHVMLAWHLPMRDIEAGFPLLDALEQRLPELIGSWEDMVVDFIEANLDRDVGGQALGTFSGIQA